MDANQLILWEKVEAFELDEPASPLPFSVRLARENGWSLRYAHRAIEEYKRFVFLATTAGHPVCPSEEVDAVWHLHLCYTRSYWHDLCRDTLGQPLHHEPTRGGNDQLEHHRSMYEQTQAAYRQFFGKAPPEDIWPSTDERFAKGGRERHVNSAEHWVVPKPRFGAIKRSWQSHSKQWLLMAGIGLLPMFGAITNPLNMRGPEFLDFYFWLVILTIVAGIVMRLLFRQADDGRPLPELDSYEVATLAAGVDHAINLAVTDLALSNAITVAGKKTIYLASSTGKPAQHPLSQSIHQIAVKGDGNTLFHVRSKVKPEATKIAARLESEGLLESNASFAAGRWLPVLLLSGVLLLGLAKIAVGLSRDKPVLFLVIFCAFVPFAIYKFHQMPLRTRRGNRVLAGLKKHYQDHGEALKAADESGHQLLGAGLFGLVAIAGAGGLAAEVYKTLKTEFKTGSSSVSGGCGGGCGGGGGGGCGGGCGGCGGD